MILSLILFLLIIFYAVSIFYLKRACPAKSYMGGPVVINKKKIDQSYTLLSPYIALSHFTGKGAVYLLDLFGKVVHKWETKHQVFAAFLKKNGNLVISNVIANNLDQYPGGGKSGCISELNWEGKVIWEYHNNHIHHDFEVMPNGNIVALMYERIPRDLARKIQGGISGSECDGDMWSDAIIEVDHSKKIIWRWCAYEHLNFEEYRLNRLTPRSELMHSNSIRYLEKDPFGSEEAFLISMRHLNTIAIIRKRDGEVLWKSPKGMFSFQHDATLLPNGNILAFDNGFFRFQKRPFLSSWVSEVNPKTNRIVWWFNGGETGTEKAKFAASILGGTQRLKNGNTLIVNGLQGHLFEVTKDKKIVWDLINPCTTFSTGAWPNNIIFRARRYRKEEIDWPEKISRPLPKFPEIMNKIIYR
jgi:hypothetical protein